MWHSLILPETPLRTVRDLGRMQLCRPLSYRKLHDHTTLAQSISCLFETDNSVKCCPSQFTRPHICQNLYNFFFWRWQKKIFPYNDCNSLSTFIENNSLDVLLNIFFCVPQRKWSQMGNGSFYLFYSYFGGWTVPLRKRRFKSTCLVVSEGFVFVCWMNTFTESHIQLTYFTQFLFFDY